MSKLVVSATWDDVPHLSAEQKAALWGSIPPYQRDARSKGIPQLGSGAIYPVPESEIVVDPFELPLHWPRGYGLDVGWNRTAAIWGAHDRDTDAVYLWSEHYRGQAEPSVHAAAIRARGEWMQGAVDPAARGRGQRDGEQLLQNYIDLGLLLTKADNGVEAGLFDVWERLSTGRLKVFRTLQSWLGEYRLYRRDEKGAVVKKDDHLMDATRYFIVSGLPLCLVAPDAGRRLARGMPAAGEIALFGGNRARDLQVAGQNLGQASDSLFALYQRTAREANDARVQDLTNRFLDGRRAILQTYSSQTGADAIAGADAATGSLTALREEAFGQTANDYQRQRLGPILDAHLAASTVAVTRHAVAQQDVYSRGVAANAIEISRAEAKADPALIDNAVLRAEDAARAQHAGQPPEAVEAGVRIAGGSVFAGVIGDRLARNDPMGVALFRRYADRLDPGDRRTLGAAAETLSNTVEATAWLRDRSAGLRTPAPTGDAALDAVNTASASTAAPQPLVTSGGTLLDQDGIVGTRERLDEIENRRRALTALNQQELIANPARLRANQAAIDADTARGRAAVKAEADSLYADLRRHLTTGGPNGGPAVTPPPATIMSRLTYAQQDAVAAQVNGAIEGRKPSTDPQTWYAIRQGLTGDDASERQRWASKNLVQFMGRLSDEDFAALEKLQTAVRTNDGGAEQSRLQTITQMANQSLRAAGIDPMPRPDASPDSDAAQAAKFHRALQDELSVVESKGRKLTEAEAYDIVNGLKDMGIKRGWLKVNDGPTSLTVASDVRSTNDAFGRDGTLVAQAGPSDDKPQEGRSGIAPTTEPYPGSPVYRDAQQLAESLGRSGVAPLTEPPSNDPDFIKSQETWPGVPVVLPNGDHIEDPKSPTGYVMAPFPGLRSVVDAARRARSEVQVATAVSSTATPFVVALMIRDMLKRNVGHGGDFDYQRRAHRYQKDGYVQLRQFRNISNVNVGLFCQQLGLPRTAALTIAGVYAYLFSSNSKPNEPYYLDADTKKYIDVGFDLGERGLFD